LSGVLLDSHTLYWFVSATKQLAEKALLAIGESQEAGALFVSPISAWELSIAAGKPAHQDRPDLGDGSPAHWFREALKATEAKIIPIKQRISLEAAEVVTTTGHKDPGDIFLIATARVRKIPLITRDVTLRGIAEATPDYLSIIVC
jgi:PIN domain nuclease of toxin-antitoxin system